jgi:NAD(P)-dependent dehydrogenase (short-subunit alcohol dehydrogenase family)
MFGRLDILILNNSARMPYQLFEKMSDFSSLQKLMDINLYGQVYTTKYALPHLKKTHGQLVISSSLAGQIGLLERSGYCASKFAATGFFEALRMEVNKHIDITIICPPSVVVSSADTLIEEQELLDGKLIRNRVSLVVGYKWFQ